MRATFIHSKDFAETNPVMVPVAPRPYISPVIRSGVAILLALVVGCGESGPPLTLVTGKVTIDGKPATEGGVTYYDVATGLQQFAGAIDADGSYSIRSRKEPGLPAGVYNVTVLVTETAKNTTGDKVALPKAISHQKFFNVKTTPFKIEVKADAPPGAYDLAVTR